MIKKTRGLRNNNPLNIRKGSDKFVGEVTSSDSSFRQFVSAAYGYRAAFVILATYHSRGVNTLEKIIYRWAPPSDGNYTESYVANVAKRSGVSRHKVLSLSDGKDYINIVTAMCYSENGVLANPSDVEVGFNLQDRIRR